MTMRYDAVVLGAGLYGVKVALTLREMGLKKVLLMDPHPALLAGATATNQNRVHSGLHYPRHLATAASAQENYRRFLVDHALTIEPNGRHLYAIAEGSKTTPEQFEQVASTIGARADRVETPGWFDAKAIQQVYEVDEVPFHIGRLRAQLGRQLEVAGVEVRNERGIIQHADEGRVIVRPGRVGRDTDVIVADYVFNCTYAYLDLVTPIKTRLKKEWTEVALVRPPSILMHTDITIMDGPFWSLMRFPWKDCWALTHVKHTPHYEWFSDEQGLPAGMFKKGPSKFAEMIVDGIAQVPALRATEHLESMYTTRVVLADNEEDDGRPVLWEYSPDSPRVISILGSKFNSVYDVMDKVRAGEWVTRGSHGTLRVVGRRALIGRGFVGTNLDKPGRFTDRFHSGNIGEMKGRYQQVVIAAPGARKWYANSSEEGRMDDLDAIIRIDIATVFTMAEDLVLLSSIDVRHDGSGAYGMHRRWLEQWIRARFPHARIVRLPALYGPGLKKNALYDLMHRQHPHCYPTDTFQWYNVENLWEDLKKVKPGETVDFVPEPIPMSWIAEQLGQVILVRDGVRPATNYDFRTPEGGYTEDAASVKQGLLRYFRQEGVI
jgi:hypothetical protein